MLQSSTTRNARAGQSSTCASTAPTHTLPGLDSETYIPTPNSNHSIYYRVFSEEGVIPSKKPASPGDPFLGRIKARSVPPPHRDRYTAKAIKLSIAEAENINDNTYTSLFLTPYSQSPMGDTDKVMALNHIASGPGSTPQDPLAFVAKISGTPLSSTELETTPDLEIRYLYYLLYGNYEIPSKVAFDPEEPALGRIQADSVAPPHNPFTIKGRISRVERTPAIVSANLFADISCNTPLEKDHISFLRTDCPGLSPENPMAIVLTPLAPLAPLAMIADGRYAIKNRAAAIFWNANSNPMGTVYFLHYSLKEAKELSRFYMQWDITHDANGNISMISPYHVTQSCWVGAEIAGSKVPVPWRLIQADSNFYYLTTDMNRDSRDPRVPAAQPGSNRAPGKMATLQEGNHWQMWEFICVDSE